MLMNAKNLPALLACAALALPAHAQYRENMPEVLPARAAPAAPVRTDPALLFQKAYSAAGSPRVMLMWNRELAEVIPSPPEPPVAAPANEVVREQNVSVEMTRRSTTISTEITVVGQAGARSAPATPPVPREKRELPSPQQGPKQAAPAERQALVLQRAFGQELRRGGMRFIDRTMSVRAIGASTYRNGGDPVLVEVDALQKYADFLMEVIMVEDQEAPAGYGFDVRVKDVRSGEEFIATYSRGIPEKPVQGPGAWVAGKDDYEFRRPPAAPAPRGANDVGIALARDVMQLLGGAIAQRGK